MTSPAHIVSLTDSTGQAKAEILVSQGFNCFQLSLVTDKQPSDWLWATEQFATGKERPSRCGIPILFPFPGRIGGGRFDWHGTRFQLETNDGLGNAIHGFVHTRAWTVVEHHPDRLIGEISSDTFADELSNRWPASFRLLADYQLFADRLETRYTVENPGQQPLPFGLGLHPYFRLPKTESQRDDIKVRVPINRHWSLDQLLPNGEVVDLPSTSALRNGQAFSSMHYDDVFSDPDVYHSQVTSCVTDSTNGRRLLIEASPEFRSYVLYTPPHREAVCVEPYTTLPDMFRMCEQDNEPNVRVLPAGKRETFGVTYRVEAVARET